MCFSSVIIGAEMITESVGRVAANDWQNTMRSATWTDSAYPPRGGSRLSSA